MRSKIVVGFVIAAALLTNVCSAANFNALVESNQVAAGQPIELRLELEGAKASNGIDLSTLAQNFVIHRSQQYSSYSNVNGKVSAQTGWLVLLTPKKIGTIMIPAIAIATDQGTLTSNPIQLEVSQHAGSKSGEDALGISLVSSVNKAKAMVNETIIYTVKIISYKPVANVVLEDIKSNDALIEKLGDAKQYDQHYGGVHAHIIELKYAITPLKAGRLEIPPASMSGELHVPMNPHKNSRFGIFGNPFFDNLGELRPFNMQSETIGIDVSAAQSNAAAWLPLHKLSMTQTWDIPNKLSVGETITRKVKMTAIGGFAKQLPSLKDFMQIPGVKLYANKPKFNDNFDERQNNVVGVREEEYSIVVQNEGTITFPAIEVQWWNLKTKKMESTTLPEKSFNVEPNAQAATPNVTLDYSTPVPQQVAQSDDKLVNKSNVFYVLLGVLGGVLISALLFIGYRIIRRKIKRRKKPIQNMISEITTVANLRDAILQHAVASWQLAKSVTLNRLGDALTVNNYVYDVSLYSVLLQQINSALYAEGKVDLESLIQLWGKFKQSVHRNKTQKSKHEAHEGYSSLNPT